VDDSATNQKVGRLMLENLGCSVDVAGDGKEALEMIQLVPYDVVFMDCEMPEMDGFAATVELRRRQAGGRHLPVVAMTAKAIQGDRERCLAAGMDDYVSKPVRLEGLVAALARWTINRPDPQSAAPPRGTPRPGELSDAENGLLDPGRPGQLPAQPEEDSEESAQTPPATPAPKPALDPVLTQGLQDMAACLDPSVLAEIYEVFQSGAVEYLAALRRAVSEREPEALRTVAHALKGASANVGATTLAEVATQLEALGQAHSLANADQLLAALEREFARVQLEIRTQALLSLAGAK